MKKIKAVYDSLGLEPQTWIELYLKDGKVTLYQAVAHAGYSREGRPFNEYTDNLFLVIEGREKNLWNLLDLLKRMKFWLPDDRQKARKKWEI